MNSHFHPSSVHFPIALTVLGFIFLCFHMIFREKKSIYHCAVSILFFALAGLGLAYLTGEYFTAELSGEMHELKEEHELFSKITSFTLLGGMFLWFLLKNKRPVTALWLLFIFTTATVGLILYTGYLGGSLVYDQMIPGELLQ